MAEVRLRTQRASPGDFSFAGGQPDRV